MKRTIEISGVTFTEGEEVTVTRHLVNGENYEPTQEYERLYVAGYNWEDIKVDPDYLVVNEDAKMHGWYLDVRDPGGVQIIFPAFEPVSDDEVKAVFGLT